MCGPVAMYTTPLTAPLSCSTGHNLTSTMCRCDSTYSNGQTFFVGGIDLFSDYHNASWNNDFVGIIRNLVIDSVQVDLASPIREENTARGILFPSEPKCGELEMTCSGPHYTGCLDYDMESHCICAGGFNTDTCKEEESKYRSLQATKVSTASKIVT